MLSGDSEVVKCSPFRHEAYVPNRAARASSVSPICGPRPEAYGSRSGGSVVATGSVVVVEVGSVVLSAGSVVGTVTGGSVVVVVAGSVVATVGVVTAGRVVAIVVTVVVTGGRIVVSDVGTSVVAGDVTVVVMVGMPTAVVVTDAGTPNDDVVVTDSVVTGGVVTVNAGTVVATTGVVDPGGTVVAVDDVDDGRPNMGRIEGGSVVSTVCPPGSDSTVCPPGTVVGTIGPPGAVVGTVVGTTWPAAIADVLGGTGTNVVDGTPSSGAKKDGADVVDVVWNTNPSWMAGSSDTGCSALRSNGDRIRTLENSPRVRNSGNGGVIASIPVRAGDNFRAGVRPFHITNETPSTNRMAAIIDARNEPAEFCASQSGSPDRRKRACNPAGRIVT